MGSKSLGFWMLGLRFWEMNLVVWRVGYLGIKVCLGFCLRGFQWLGKNKEEIRKTREWAILFFWVWLRMPQYSWLKVAALESRTSGKFLQSTWMLRHWVTNAAALGILTSKNFSYVIWMSRHWVLNATALGILTSTIFSSLMSMPRHWETNAAALESRPKWMPWHSFLNAAALSPVSACLCFSTFQPHFFSYFWPEQPMNHKMKKTNEK